MQFMTPRNIEFAVLSEEKKQGIHEASLALMAEAGLKIEGEKTRALLFEHGAKLNNVGLITIPEELVQKALTSVPKELALYSRSGEQILHIDSSNAVGYGTHADNLYLLDPESGLPRKFKRKDIRLMCNVADALDNVHFVLCVGLASDVPEKIQSQISFLDTVRSFGKISNFSTNDVQAVEDIIEMASIVAGSLENLQRKPFVFNYCEPIPPRLHPEESTEKLRISAEKRIPVVYMPYSMMGGTAPLSLAGSIAQCNADILTGLVISQLAGEGAPYIYGSMPSIMDMGTTIGSYAAPEFHLCVAAASEMADYYGLPFYGTAACSDARVLDEQAVSEATQQLFSTMLSKANLVHDLGIMEHAKSTSPEMIVLADEIIQGLKHYTQGVEVNEEELALELINKVAPGGNYLLEDHTHANFKNIWYPKLFTREMQPEDASQVRPRIKKRIREINYKHHVPELELDVLKELEQWEKLLQKR